MELWANKASAADKSLRYARIRPAFRRGRMCAMLLSCALVTYSGDPRFVAGIPRSSLAWRYRVGERWTCKSVSPSALTGPGSRDSAFRSMACGLTSTVRSRSMNVEQRSRRASTARANARTAIRSKLLQQLDLVVNL